MLKFVADVGYVNTMGAPTASGKQQRVLRRASAGSVCATMPGRDSRQAEQLQKVDEPEQPLTGAEKKLVAELRARMDARHRAPRVKLDHRPPKPVDIATADGEPQTSEVARLTAFGTTSGDFYSRTLQELLEAGCRGTQSQPFTEVDVNGALAAMHGITPRDEIEGMLAAQMIAVHSAAMRSLRQLKSSETIMQQDSNGNLAVKLLRTYTMQMEALQRYRGKGEQKMTVEHVHVYQGGQAIVGAVQQGGGPRTKTEEQPHAQAITHEPGAALSRPDPQREAVPIAGGEG
jgi:hypothetical protein